MNRQILLAGLSGFLAVALGAFGAHALKVKLAETGFLETWHTAALYHLLHSAALLGAALGADLLGPGNEKAARDLRLSCTFWGVGLLLFSGSLYALSLTGLKPLGGITPFGGVALLVGWLFVCKAALDFRRQG